MITKEMLTAENPVALLEEVQKIELNNPAVYMINSEYRGYLTEKAGREHYKLISAIASMFEGQTVYDIGTHMGNSSLALGANKNVKVVSYDIVNCTQLLASPPNVQYKIGDFRMDTGVLKSPFIFIDVDPHDGIQEAEFHTWLAKHKYAGIVLWDDIHCNNAMETWWTNIATTKYDLTPAGHWSGTGMTLYV